MSGQAFLDSTTGHVGATSDGKNKGNYGEAKHNEKKKSEKQRSETAVENVDKRVSGPAKQETSKDEAITIGDRIQHSEKEGNGEKEIEPEAEGKVEENRTEEKERRRR